MCACASPGILFFTTPMLFLLVSYHIALYCFRDESRDIRERCQSATHCVSSHRSISQVRCGFLNSTVDFICSIRYNIQIRNDKAYTCTHRHTHVYNDSNVSWHSLIILCNPPTPARDSSRSVRELLSFIQ